MHQRVMKWIEPVKSAMRGGSNIIREYPMTYGSECPAPEYSKQGYYNYHPSCSHMFFIRRGSVGPTSVLTVKGVRMLVDIY